jgi:glucose/arabinose dehydrogenase
MNNKLILCLCATGLVAGAFAWQQAPAKLPPPYHTPSASNGPRIIPRPDGTQFKVPAGFDVQEFAADFEKPRFMLLGPSNEVLVSDSIDKGIVYVISGKDKARKKLIEGLNKPYGLAFWKDYLYVAEATSVKRYKYNKAALSVGPGEEIVAMKDFTKGHWTRSIVFDSKGEKFYLGVGSSSNVDAGDPPTRAAINRYNPDGSGHEIFTEGMRNPIGLHFYPGSNTLWAAVQERDGLGDELVPDYFIAAKQGGFYGFPYAYAGQNEEPRRKGERPDLVKKSLAPDVLLEPHCAVLDFIFYTGKQFPARYQNGALLANHGSSNRSKRLGYSVTFIPFKNGRPSGPAEELLSGFMLSPDSREVWGRPVALLQLADGSVLLSEDGGKKIYRISYKG